MGELASTVISRAAAGDEAAFAQILEAHKDMVYTIAYRTLRNTHDAEEVLQDTFLSAFRNLPRFRGDSKLSTWLYRIAVNRCRDFLSSRAAKNARQTSSLDDDSGLDRHPSLALNPSDDRENVHEAIALLPENLRIAVNLRCIMGYTYDETADIMGVPEGTVKTYVHRAKAELCRILQQPE